MNSPLFISGSKWGDVFNICSNGRSLFLTSSWEQRKTWHHLSDEKKKLLDSPLERIKAVKMGLSTSGKVPFLRA